MFAYSYTRFSTVEQKHGNSEQRQKAKFQEICIKHNLTPAREYFDAGASAYKGNKQRELQDFLQLVIKGEIPKGSWLVIESFDRLSRKGFRPTLRILEQIIEQQITVCTTNPERILTGKSLDDPMSLIEVLFIASRAREESDLKSDRVSKAWNAKLLNAENKIVTARCPAWLKLVGNKWEIIPERVAIINSIFKMALQQKLGARAIGKRLNTMGIKAWSGKEWGAAYIRLILSDGRCIGHAKFKTGRVENYFPAIIDKEQFEKVQALCHKRRRFRGNINQKVSNLFTGLAYDKSGATMIYIKKNADKAARLISSKFERTQCKNTCSFPYEIFEEQILRVIDGLTLAEVSTNENIGEEITNIELEIAKLDNHLAEMKAVLGQIGAPPREVIEKMTELANERKSLYEQLEQVRGKILEDKPEYSLNDSQAIMERLQSLKGKQLVNARLRLRDAIRNLVSRIEVEITKSGWNTTLDATLSFHSGHIRRLSIEVRRGELSSVMGDEQKWQKTEPEQFAEYTIDEVQK